MSDKNFKFAHISDVHLGAWRNESLTRLGYEAFTQAVNIILDQRVDFVVISGDLYDISNPKVEVVDLATRLLKKLKDHGIPVYGIMGSHDFSPSNKSMIRPLISAGLYTDLFKGDINEDGNIQLNFTQDSKTGVKLVGLRARKRSLEIEDFKELDRESLEAEPGPKIFVFHTLLSELKPKEFKDMESAPKSLLPLNFNYYAAGHMHKTVPELLREEGQLEINDTNNIIYPGSLTPTNFRELEQMKFGGFCIVSGKVGPSSQSSLKVRYIPLKIKDVHTLTIDGTNKSVEQIYDIIDQKLLGNEHTDKIITIRIAGVLASGKIYEINAQDIIQKFKEKGAYEVLINKISLISKEYTPVSVYTGKSNEEIEKALIDEHIQKVDIDSISKKQLKNKIYELIDLFGNEREEGTSVKDFEAELKQGFSELFNLDPKGGKG